MLDNSPGKLCYETLALGTFVVKSSVTWDFKYTSLELVTLVRQIWWIEGIHPTSIRQLVTFLLFTIGCAVNLSPPPFFESQFAKHKPLQTFIIYGIYTVSRLMVVSREAKKEQSQSPKTKRATIYTVRLLHEQTVS